MFEVVLNYCALIVYSFLMTVKRPDVCQAEVTNMNVRGGRMKRKMQSFAQQTSLDGEFICQPSKISFSYVCLVHILTSTLVKIVFLFNIDLVNS